MMMMMMLLQCILIGLDIAKSNERIDGIHEDDGHSRCNSPTNIPGGPERHDGGYRRVLARRLAASSRQTVFGSSTCSICGFWRKDRHALRCLH